ncbi:MAG: DNA alkylation repair protein, partial [Duncaniella sp.]|nr:DNA alkylation repair protein [Duncaniella sp.]
LNLPQLTEIAGETGFNESLALELRDDILCRESQLLAPMLYAPERLSAEEAMEWISKVTSIEAADILCHKLLRKIPAAWEVVEKAMVSDDAMTRYTAARLTFNLLYSAPDRVEKVAKALSDDTDTLVSRIAAQMLEELEFIKD